MLARIRIEMRQVGLRQEASCFGYTIKECGGACINEENKEKYNNRVKKIIANNSFKTKSMIIIDQGRAVDERSAVWVDQGLIKGFTYFNLNFQITNIDVLANLITPLEHNKDAQHIIQSYVRRNKRIKVISLED